MYQFLRYGGDLCSLFSLFFFWLVEAVSRNYLLLSSLKIDLLRTMSILLHTTL